MMLANLMTTMKKIRNLKNRKMKSPYKKSSYKEDEDDFVIKEESNSDTSSEPEELGTF